MSALQCRNPYEDDRVWRQYSSVIRQLYQEDKKTLKEVKEIMENEKGFPVTPISIWEVKLRQLGMRKKMKAKDWPLVYQHVRPRLEHEGRKKLRKPTAILINDTMKPWDDCWREFRRNGALGRGPPRGPLPPLPSGIMIRTPSPELIESTVRMKQAASPGSHLLTLFQTTVAGFQPLLGPESQPTAESSDILMLADSVYRLCLEEIPFTKVLETIPDLEQGSLPSPRDQMHEIQHYRITPPSGFSDNLIASWHPGSWRSRLTGIIAHLSPQAESAFLNGRDLSLNFNNHHYLSLAVYLLSNAHIRSYVYEDDNSAMLAVFEMTFRFVNRRVLLALFQSRSPSIRAAWEELYFWTDRLENREAFRVLIKVGMDNDWLEETINGHQHLYFAAQNNCGDLVSALLAKGCRADSPFGQRQRTTAIMAALNNGDLNCAKLLIQHCDVNRDMSRSTTNFTVFIQHFDEANEVHHCCLGLFLEQGANVDYEFNIDSLLSIANLGWHQTDSYGLLQDWPLSILDHVFYFHRQLFPKLAAFSKASGIFTRSRALWCLEQGVQMLQEYLHESLDFPKLRERSFEEAGNGPDVRVWKGGWLEVLLAEQFLLSRYIPDRIICCKTVQGLLGLGADLQSLSTREWLATATLYATAHLITSGEGHDGDKGRHLMQELLDQGFQVQGDALSLALDVTGQDVAMLECLATYCPDLKKHGAQALFTAIHLNNFDAIRFLLDEGVDPNSSSADFYGDFEIDVFTEVATTTTLATLKYLARRGTKPGNCKPGDHLSDVLVGMLSVWSLIPEQFAKVQYIVEEYITVPGPIYPSAYVLEACLCDPCDIPEARRTFEYLFRKGASLTPGSPLASWVAAGGGHQLVGQMLDAGANVNAYRSDIFSHGELMSIGVPRLTPLQAAARVGDYTLVCWFLERGASLNPPVLDQRGTTALQEICLWDPLRPEERIRKDKIIKVFLDKGADVNALSSMEDANGRTALFCAAAHGDLSTAFLLLKHGANPNAKSAGYLPGSERTALDVAAEQGRLDMVDFLLNANGLSASATSDAQHYDGAIEKARINGHFAVAELIRKHSVDRKRGWNAAKEQRPGTAMLGDDETLLSLIQGSSPMILNRQAGRQYTSGLTNHNVEYLVGSRQVDCDRSPGIPDSKLTSEAEEESTLGAEATDMGWDRAIEDIKDESLLPDSGREEALEEDGDSVVDQNAGGCEASSGTGRGLSQAGGQVWDVDEEPNDRQLVPGSLDTDVFMGYSEFARP